MSVRSERGESKVVRRTTGRRNAMRVGAGPIIGALAFAGMFGTGTAIKGHAVRAGEHAAPVFRVEPQRPIALPVFNGVPKAPDLKRPAPPKPSPPPNASLQGTGGSAPPPASSQTTSVSGGGGYSSGSSAPSYYQSSPSPSVSAPPRVTAPAPHRSSPPSGGGGSGTVSGGGVS
jgi:hypothetical protein